MHNSSGNFPSDPSFVPFVPVEPSPINLNPYVIPQAPSEMSQDSVSSFDKKKESEDEYMLRADIPYLLMPWIPLTDFLSFLKLGLTGLGIGNGDKPKSKHTTPLDLQLAYDKISIGILDNWLKGIKEVDAQREKDRNSPIARALEDYLRKLESGQDSTGIMKATALAPIVILGTAFTIIPGTPPKIVAATGAQDGNFALIGGAMNQAGLGNEIGLLGAMMAGGLIYQSTWATVAGTKINQKQENYDAEYGKNYAAAMVNLCNNPGFTAFALSHVNQQSNAKELSNEQKEQQVSTLKVTLLFMALALVTKIETKHLTDIELGEMILGKLSLPENDPRQAVIASIQEQLRILPEDQRAKLVNSLLTYFNKNPAIEEFTEPVNVLKSLFASQEFEIKERDPTRVG